MREQRGGTVVHTGQQGHVPQTSLLQTCKHSTADDAARSNEVCVEQSSDGQLCVCV
jgi:hypothetical protein